MLFIPCLFLLVHAQNQPNRQKSQVMNKQNSQKYRFLMHYCPGLAQFFTVWQEICHAIANRTILKFKVIFLDNIKTPFPLKSIP